MEAELQQQYAEMGIESSVEVLAKSAELAVLYQATDAVEFVEEWLAYSLSHLGGAEPTVAYLEEFERKTLQPKRDKKAQARQSQPSSLPVYSQEDEAELLAFRNDDDDQLIATPKRNSVLPRTPAHKGRGLFSPAGNSPRATPGTPATPGRAGDIIYTFGNPKQLATAQWSIQLPGPYVPARQLLEHDGASLSTANLKYMFDSVYEQCELAMDRIIELGEQMVRKLHGDAAVDDYDWYQLAKGTQDTLEVIGTVHSDYDGPLDANSAVLAVPDKYGCRYLNLNFTQTASVALFPGQVVLAAGTNPSGEIFVVQSMHMVPELAPPTLPKLDRALSFVLAAGPYTQTDDLLYEPLYALMHYVRTCTPDVLVLTGPFLAAKHSENHALTEPFETFFEKMLAGIVDAVGASTTILIVASGLDAHTHAVYPTPPPVLKQHYPNVYLLPDPSIVDLDGLTLGVTSTDIYDHLIQSELAINAGDKVKRVVNHLCQQRSFYPLRPSPNAAGLCFDSQLAHKYAALEQLPNVLILPSDQKCFVRVVNNCLVINPGRLADAKGGSYARFFYTPPMPNNGEAEPKLFNSIGCQIRRI